MGGLIGGILTISNLIGINIPFSLPLGLVIMFVCLSVAQFLAYHGLRKTNIKLDADLEEAKSYQSKSQRIDIISKEKYPSEILRIFDDMRRCLSEIIETSDNVPDVTSKKLFDCANGSPHDLYRALHQKTINDNVYVTFTFYRHFNYGIGLSDLQNKNDRWKQLLDELETIKKDIPDQELKESVVTHFQALNGANAIRLYYRYVRKYGVNREILHAVEQFRPSYDLLDQTMTKVTKRIVELKLGEEPKWEMRYFRSEQ